jgi:hypothetical protein
MDLSKIYSKTGKGTRALSAKAKELPKHALKVLPLIDSTTSVRDILAKLGKFSETDLHIVLTQLESGGYIRALQDDNWDDDNAQPANASSIVVEEVSHEDFLRSADDGPAPVPQEPQPTEPEAENAALLQAQRVYQEFAERLARETQKQAEQDAQVKALEAQRKTREEVERKAAEERSRVEAEAAAAREAERLVKAEEARQAELAKILFEAEHAARLEAERVAREKAERAARLAEEARLRIEAEAREAAEKLALEEAKRKLREEEEARKQAEAERKAREAAEKKAKQEEEARLKAEAKEKARLEKAAKEEAERQAKQRAREEEAVRRQAEAERIAKEEAERQVQQEEEARLQAAAKEKERLEKAAQEEAARQAREAANQRAREAEEVRRKAEAEQAARKEAERQAEREAEARLRAEAEAKAEVERQTRLAAEAQAKAEAEQRANEVRKAARLAEAERKAVHEVALQERKAEEAQRKAEAAEAKRHAKEEARREAEERAQMKLEQKQRARAERVAKKIAATRQRKRAVETGNILGKVAKTVLVYFPLALVVLVVALHYVNLAPFAAPVVRAASESLGEPVRFSSLHAALLPQPELRLAEVQLGETNPLQFDTVRIEFALATLFDPIRRVERLEVENGTMNIADLDRVQRWFLSSSEAKRVEIANVAFRNIALAVPALKLPAFSGNIALAADGSFDNVNLASQEGNLSLKLQPDNGAWKFSLDARAWQPPLRTALKFDELRAEGVLRGQTAQLESMGGSIYAGTFKGSSMIAWKDQPRITGHFVTENIRLEQATAAGGNPPGLEGALAADVTFSSASHDIEALAESAVANAKFTVTDGKVLGIDLASSMLPGNRERSTRFDQLTGTLQSDATAVHLRQLLLESSQLRARGQLDVSNNREIEGKATAELLIPSRRMQASFGLSGKVGDMWIK